MTTAIDQLLHARNIKGSCKLPSVERLQQFPKKAEGTAHDISSYGLGPSGGSDHPGSMMLRDPLPHEWLQCGDMCRCGLHMISNNLIPLFQHLQYISEPGTPIPVRYFDHQEHCFILLQFF